MGTIERSPLPPPRENETREFPWTRALLAATIVILGWIGYQQATKPAKPEPPPGWLLAKKQPAVVYVVEKPKAESKPEPKQPDPSTPIEAPAASSVEHSSVQDFRLKDREPTPTVPVALPTPAPKKRETWDELAQRCLEFSGDLVTTDPIIRPTSVLVDLHAINRCIDNFAGDHVWATAFLVGEQAGVVGSYDGHFSGTIVGYATATTRLEVACNPDLVRSVLARLRFYTP
jgi:hypothetical protein